jgi:O-succinylbenzoic acid--CoA ligase
MNHFDFNQHFKKFNHNNFFENITYDDLLTDVTTFSSSPILKSSGSIALKIQSPYLAFVALLACIKLEKIAVLVSHLETPSMIEKLRGQINFDTVIEDIHVKNTNPKKVTNTLFPNLNLNLEALVVFSSGTTSLPKGVALSFNNLYYSALGFAEFFKLEAREKSMINLPHHHVGGLMIMWRAFFTGGSVTTDFNSPIDFLSLVPLQLKRMMNDPLKLNILKTIRVILIGGSRFQETLKIEAKSHGLNVYETYGMSETAALITIDGKVLPYRELDLTDHGMFKVKGKTLAVGYFENNNLIKFTSEWFQTNDLGIKDNLGLFQFTGRADLQFISGGENINPLLVEEMAKENELVSDAYLTPIKDEKWGEMGILLFEAQENIVLSAADLNTFLKTKLHPHHVPKFYFETKLKIEGQLKIKRSELAQVAEMLYLKDIFSFDFFEIKDAPVMVFFHGFMGDKDDLQGDLSSHISNYSRLYIDLPGHGKTRIQNFYSSHDIFLKLSSLIQIFTKNPLFYGYSMGGRIALHMALHYLKPKFLFLESAGLGLEHIEDQEARKKSDVDQFTDINQNQLSEFLNRWYQNPIFNNYSNHISFQSEMKKKSSHDFHQWQDSQKFLTPGYFPLIEENLIQLERITFPLVYIYGELDLKYKSIGERLKHLSIALPITVIEISQASHNPNKTHPLEIALIVSNLLR